MDEERAQVIAEEWSVTLFLPSDASTGQVVVARDVVASLLAEMVLVVERRARGARLVIDPPSDGAV